MRVSAGNRRWRALGISGVLAVLFASGAACSRLPEAAAPKRRGDLTQTELESRDVIPYRTLTRDDFRGTEPPAEFRELASKLGATTCSHLLTAENTVVQLTERRAGGQREFASQPRNLRFRALMDRSCSWWNDELSSMRPEYVLQHEQIHFAITEIEARRLNASAAELAERSFTAETQRAALKLAEEAIQERLLEGSEAVLERSRDFDEDTSMGYEPERQAAWFARISEELEETRAWAAR